MLEIYVSGVVVRWLLLGLMLLIAGQDIHNKMTKTIWLGHFIVGLGSWASVIVEVYVSVKEISRRVRR